MADYLHCIITSIRRYSNPVDNVYTAISEDGTRAFKSGLILNLRDSVEIQRSAMNGETIPMESIKVFGEASGKEYKALMKKLLKKNGLKEKRTAAPHTIPELAGPTKKMLNDLNKAALKLVRCIFSGAPVLVRFHNDCDGSSGAIALYEALLDLQKRAGIKDIMIAWRMNKTVGYLPEYYYSDQLYFNSYETIEQPVILITDFGTSKESEEAIRLSKDKFDFIWLDHHPIYDGFPKDKLDNYINTWDYGSDSDYTAGYLTCVFAELISPIGTEDLKVASLIGDFSVFGKRDDKVGQKLAIVLDYLTGKKDFDNNITPKYMASVIRNSEKYEEASLRASGIITEALDIGVKKVKHYKARNSINIYVLDFKHITKDGDEYMLPGRFSSRLQEKMEEINGKRTITMVHYGNYVSLRANRYLAEEIQLLKVLEDVRDSSDYVYSFGGHNPAASVRTDKEHVLEVVKLILEAFGAA